MSQDFLGLESLLGGSTTDMIEISSDGKVEGTVETKAPEGAKTEQKAPELKHSMKEMFEVDKDLVDTEAKVEVETKQEAEDKGTPKADEKSEEEEKPESKEGEEKEEESNVYKILGGLLKEEGVLQFEDLEINNIEDLKSAVVRQAEAINDEWKENIPPVIKHLLNNYEDGVPLDQLINIKSNEIRYSGITDDKLEENVETQKAVYAEYLRNTTKFSEAKITKEVQRLEDLEELKDSAKEALTELKVLEGEKEKELVALTKQERARQEKEQKEYVSKIEETIKNTKEIIPGIALSEKEKKEVQKYMTSAVAVDAQGRPISKVQEIQAKDPIKFNMMLNYFAAKGFFEGKFDTIQTKAKTEAVKQLEASVAATSKKAAFSGTGKDGIQTKDKAADLFASLSKFKNK